MLSLTKLSHRHWACTFLKNILTNVMLVKKTKEVLRRLLSGYKCMLCKQADMSSDSQLPHKKPGLGPCICNLSTGDWVVETGGPLAPVGQQPSWKSTYTRFSDRPLQGIQQITIKKNHLPLLEQRMHTQTLHIHQMSHRTNTSDYYLNFAPSSGVQDHKVGKTAVIKAAAVQSSWISII